MTSSFLLTILAAQPKRYLQLLCFFSLTSVYLGCATSGWTSPVSIVEAPSPLRVVVNSNQDDVQPNDALTLREGIELVNGSLSLDQLSRVESQQVELLAAGDTSTIEFNLPSGQSTILLNAALPPISRSKLTIDGTTQPGFTAETESGEIPAPIVAIAPAPQTQISQGLKISANQITIRGLSLYGFTAEPSKTDSLPSADIFIEAQSHSALPESTVIENNWLGIAPAGQIKSDADLSFDPSESHLQSAFGVFIFRGTNSVIQRNRIANHQGSGIITGVRAENSQIRDNVIENNGFTGMPDAIRLEGSIEGTQVESNLIRGNAGSGVFLFKPQGSVTIQANRILSNGRRFRRAAIYLLGSGHQVVNNTIQEQTGPGVVVGAFPRSIANIVQANRFAHIDELSIDLNTQLNTDVQDFQRGDGINPRRNSPNRRLETGNAAINAPQFLSQEFLILNGKVNIDGTADPGTQIELYQVSEPGSLYGPLSEPIATTKTDSEGRFGFTLNTLQPGDTVSATATDSRYGTSEPALNAVVQSLPNR